MKEKSLQRLDLQRLQALFGVNTGFNRCDYEVRDCPARIPGLFHVAFL